MGNDFPTESRQNPSLPPHPGEEFFRSLFENAATAMAVATLDGTLLQVNPALCTLLDYSSDTLLRLKVNDITHPDDRERTRANFQAVADGASSVFHYEKRYLRRDGTSVWGLTTVTWLRNEEGRPAWCVALIQDISERKRAERSLAKSEELYRTLVDNIELGISLIDAEHRIQMINPAMARMFAKPAEAFPGSHCFREYEKADAVCNHCPGTLAMSTGRPQTVITEGIRDDGSRFTARLRAFPVPGTDGGFDRFIEVVEDITEKRRTEEALRQSEERFRSLFQHADIGMSIINPDDRFLEVNSAFCDFLGYSEQELREMTVAEVTHPEALEETQGILRRAVTGEITRFSVEKRFRHKNGNEIWGRVNSVWIPDGEGNPAYGVGLVEDITRRKQTEFELLARQKDLDHLAYHDPLTGLPNRQLLQDRLQHALAKGRRSGREAALLFLDLDRFKNINDTLGHQTGDRILCEVAGRLRGTVRETDTLARFGGDEFIVLLEEVPEPKIALQIARHIIEALASPIEVADERFHLGGSIGISLYPHNGEDVDTLLKCGEAAMYQAKEKGRGTCQFYTPDMNARTRELMLLENSLRLALAREQFVLHYQPLVDIEAGTIIGVEALVRWNHPERGTIPPGDFIPLAEETGLIVPIGDWTLRAACAQATAWQREGLPPFPVAVNISPRQFRYPQLAERIRAILAETGMAPRLLELEITEGMIMHDVDAAIRTMNELAGLGIQLAIDDFGTGYSSLHYLGRFPIRKLKIDQYFVRDITTNANDAAIASAIIALAGTMGLEVVAEGIETGEQLAFLREKACRIGQGFLFSRPLPAKELGELFRSEDIRELIQKKDERGG